jgi:hypothetical protein
MNNQKIDEEEVKHAPEVEVLEKFMFKARMVQNGIWFV